MSKILIVDDERLVIEQVRKLLKNYGYDCDFIPRPKFLYDKLDSEHFDLILLDINMEGEDGIRVLKKLKECEKYKHHTVIMMTGEANQSVISQCFEIGAADYIIKPIRELEFRARVKSVVKLQEYIKKVEEQKKEIERDKEVIISSIRAAGRIQNGLFPAPEGIQNIIPQAFILLKAKDKVGGDFYLYQQVTTKEGEKKCIIIAGDCTGHGVPGALMTTLGCAFLEEIIANKITQPDAILNKINKKLTNIFNHEDEREPVKEGMELAICTINIDKKTMCFSGAKRPLVSIKTTGECTILKGSPYFIGLQYKNQIPKFDNQTLKIDPDTHYYMFSDGFQDQFDQKNEKKYTKKQLIDFLIKNYNVSLTEQRKLLDNELERWKGDNNQTDDVLIIGFKIS